MFWYFFFFNFFFSKIEIIVDGRGCLETEKKKRIKKSKDLIVKDQIYIVSETNRIE